jgi:hypothetical protein
VKRIAIEFLGTAAEAVEDIGRITQRDKITVIADALKIYAWILSEQRIGKKIISVNGDPEGELELENFVKDEVAAGIVFK